MVLHSVAVPSFRIFWSASHCRRGLWCVFGWDLGVSLKLNVLNDLLEEK